MSEVKLTRQDDGLYRLIVMDGDKSITKVNMTFEEAVAELETRAYTKSGG